MSWFSCQIMSIVSSVRVHKSHIRGVEETIISDYHVVCTISYVSSHTFFPSPVSFLLLIQNNKETKKRFTKTISVFAYCFNNVAVYATDFVQIVLKKCYFDPFQRFWPVFYYGKIQTLSHIFKILLSFKKRNYVVYWNKFLV